MALHSEAWLEALGSPRHEILSKCPLEFDGFRVFDLAKVRLLFA